MLNLPMQSFALRGLARTAWRVLVLCLLWGAAWADSLTITRVGPCDWTCADQTGALLSCHTRVDKAIEACANRSLIDGVEYRVVPAEYRVVATVDEVPPPDPVLGAVTLTWSAPTLNEDGSQITALPLTYTIYESGALVARGVEATSFVVENLAPGSYSFTATATDALGRESRHSGTATKEIN